MKESVLVLAAIVAATLPLRAQWPQFRGPDGTGCRAGRQSAAVTWAEDAERPLEDRDPRPRVVVAGGARPAGLADDGDAGRQGALRARVDKETRQDPPRPEALRRRDAAVRALVQLPTPRRRPSIEPGRVYVTFGSPGTAAIDTATGKVLWERRDLECNHFRGAGSSPVIFDEPAAHALRRQRRAVRRRARQAHRQDRVEDGPRSVDFQDIGPDGKVKADGDFRKAFATPQIVMVGGQPVMVSIGSKATYGYDPRTGKEMWRIVERDEPFGAARGRSPATGSSSIRRGFANGQLLAVRPDGSGDVTETHVVWRCRRAACRTSRRSCSWAI